MARNYDNTGVEVGGSGDRVFVSLSDAKFVTGNKDNRQELGSRITGYVHSCDMRWNEPPEDSDMSVGWEFILNMEVKDEVRGVASESTGNVPVALYSIQFGQKGRGRISSILNVLLAVQKDLNWDGWLSLSLYKKDQAKKPYRMAVHTAPGQGRDNPAPEAYAFNKEQGFGLIGAPGGDRTGQFDDEGREIIVWKNHDNFWLIKGKQVARVSGSTSQWNFYACELNRAYKRGEYMGDATYEATLVAQYGGAAEAVTVSPASVVVEKFWKSVEGRLQGVIDESSANSLMKIVIAHLPQGVEISEVAAAVKVKLSENGIKSEFNPLTNTFAAPLTAMNIPSGPGPREEPPPSFDDLPF